jgi:methylated-DNA-[protein]-cysteine S-methyltransferase
MDTEGPNRRIANVEYDLIETPLGWMGLLASPAGLRRTTLPERTPGECVLSLGDEAAEATHSPERFHNLKRDIELYFMGRPVSFHGEATDLRDATAFQRAAWAACRSIPRGETRSYKWLASQAGRPNAFRAAGRAMATNRFPVIVPCHRVVASDGGLGGFGRGATQLDLKRRLLDLESGAA